MSSSSGCSFIVHLPGSAETINELQKGLVYVIEKMKSEPDFVNTFVHRSQDEPNTLVVYETWQCSKEDFFKNHLHKEYRTNYEANLPRLLAKPRTLEFLQPPFLLYHK